MNTFWTVFLALGGSSGVAALIYTIFKDFRDRRYTAAKHEGDIQLDDATLDKIKAEAATIYSADRRKADEDRDRQIEELRAGLFAEITERRRLSAKLDEVWLYSRGVWRVALETRPDYPPPPSLEDPVIAVTEPRLPTAQPKLPAVRPHNEQDQ